MVQPLRLKGTDGALVGDVVPGGPADVAGIKRGDVITSFNGKSIKKMSDLSREVADMPVGRTVDARILRDGKEIDVKITITEMNEEKLASRMSAPEGNLGIRVDDITPRWRAELGIRDKTGALVTNIASGSLADEAGLQAGDIIKELNHQPVNSARDFYDALNKTEHETSLLLLIKRSGQTFYVSIRKS